MLLSHYRVNSWEVSFHGPTLDWLSQRAGYIYFIFIWVYVHVCGCILVYTSA